MIRMVQMLRGQQPQPPSTAFDPTEIERRRQVAQSEALQATRPRNIKHWAEGLHQMADAGLAGYREGQITRQQESAQKEAQGLMGLAMNGPPDKATFAKLAANPYTRDMAVKMMETQGSRAHEMAMISAREAAEARRIEAADARKRAMIEWERGLPPTEREKLEMDVLRRRSEAAAQPARPDTNARKYIYGAQDEMPQLKGAEERLNEALRLLEEGIYQGFGSETFSDYNQSMPSWVPNVFSDPSKAKRTQRFNQIMSGEAISAMSEALKGATTDTEMGEFKRIISDPNLSIDAKRATIVGLLRTIQRRRAIMMNRVGELGGTMPDNPTPQKSFDSGNDPLGIR